MTEILPSSQRHVTTATGIPACLNRPAVATAYERGTEHRHYPRHYVSLEQALMAREMERC